MRISMTMSGFSAAKADKLRKAMGKKQLEVLTPMREAWVEGARESGYDPGMAAKMWEDILKFAEYAFNKSHSAAYGLLTMQTAYLKAHYPLEYMAAVLTSYTGKTEKIVHYVAECNRAGYKVLPPDVNTSGRDFTAVHDAGIRFGLAGIRGVGDLVVKGIIETRTDTGPFTSLQDFCDRVDLRQTNKKTIEALIKAGAFDSTGYTRKHLMSMMDAAVDAASKRQKDRDSGQVSMFDMFAAEDHGFEEAVPAPNGDEWDKKMKLAFEKEMLGIYVSDHPLKDIEQLIRAHSDGSLGEELSAGTTGWYAGMLNSITLKPTKKGPMMAIAKLEDLDGFVEIVLFPATLEKYRELIVEDAVLRMKGKVELDDRGRKLVVLDIQPFDGDEFAAPPKRVVIKADGNALVNGRAAALKKILTHFPGRDIVELHVWDEVAEKTHICTMPERVNADANGLYAELMEMFGAAAVESAA